MNLPSPIMSTSELEIKAEIKNEIKEEISDGFSTEDQRAFEFVQNLPMPKISCSNIKNISSPQCDTLTKRKQGAQNEPLPQRKKNKNYT